MKTIKIENIKKAEDFIKTPALSREELINALDEVIKQIDKNMESFGNQFPYSATKELKYPIIDCIEWTDGFWTGMLWLAYEYTGNQKYRNLAEENIKKFNYRIENKIEVDHHDLGFLYSPSCVAGYKLTGNEFAKETAIQAADKLIERFQSKGEFIQAWGEFNNPNHYRFIIDCMLNIPLLYWATEVTQDIKYEEIAKKHFNTSCNNVIREDASAYHTYYMDPKTGNPVRGATRQGFSDDSSWARGQAWGIYGLALNYRYTKNEDIIKLFEGMTNYFLNRLPEDNICYWDLIFMDDEEQPRDSSAAAIACCGISEMYPNLINTEKEIYWGAMNNILRSLINNYTSEKHEEKNPVLYHGVYSWHSGKGVDEGNIWGDYYYFEALIRLYKNWDPYW